MLLQLLCILLLVPALLACLYHAVLAVVGLLPARGRRPSPAFGAHRFAIVIPAHNEEAALPDVLRSCAELNYPADRFRVYVIADNCSDRTAAVARAWGVDCLERTDSDRRGKGWALEWAFERVLPGRPDAVVVLDADCTLDRQALREFDRRLQHGECVLQTCNTASNPDATLISYVGSVANQVENRLFYAPKSRLGLTVLLRGTGMVFAREVLERHPWSARSIVEDAEYTVRLYRAGLRVEFVPDVQVRSQFAAGKEQLAVQRGRWIGGNSSFGRANALRLMAEGVLRRRPLLIDLGLTLLVSQRSMLLLQMLATLLAAAAAAWLVPGVLSTTLAVLAAVLAMGHGLLLILGALLLGLNGRRLSFLLRSPLVVARWLLIALAGLFEGQPARWERTPR